METNLFKISKSNSTTSLPVDHPVLKSYSALPRCNSFSSTSSDSAVYCSSQKNLKNGKRLACESESAELSKRRRNSSGSSISSNMSGISDKDLKSISPSSNKSLIKNHSIENGNSSLNLVNGGELQNNIDDPSAVNTSPLPEDSVMLPSQRILRRQITKKGCTCCPSTRTTVVVRRYQEIFKTSKKKTVISSTKVKTYVQESSISSAGESNEEIKKPKTGASRKRRSEVEKLYESLHEIEWAKNFSPDNILQQINIRQAASCSIFGSCHTKSETVHQNKSKKQKSCNEFPFKPPSSKNGVIYPKTISKKNPSSANDLLSDTKLKVSDSESKQISKSSSFLHEPNFNSCDSQSSVNITCSVSHINVKEINLKSTESVHHAQSLLTINGTDFNDDAQLSYTSDESSSAISSSIVNLQSKHQLDLDYKNRTNKDLSDVDISELSATPTFIDIAEEGIRTIDACFREVGAEVVVSTCYDDNSLPSLQSADENAAKKGISDDDPPVLEPYVSASTKQDQVDSSRDETSFIVSNTIDKNSETIQKISYNAQDSINNNSKSFISDKSFAKFNADTLNKCYSYFIYKNNRDVLLLKAGRKILNKYLKFLYSRTQPKVSIQFYSEEMTNTNDEVSEESDNDDSSSKQFGLKNSEHLDNRSRLKKSNDNFSVQFDIEGNSSEKCSYENNHLSSSDGDSENEDGFSDAKESDILYKSFRGTAFSYPMPIHAPQTVPNVGCQVFNKELNSKTYSTDRLTNNIYDASKSSSFVFNSVSTLKHKSKVNTYITSKVQSVSQQNIISSFIPTGVEGTKKVEESVCRPISSIGSSSSYHAIRVVRCTTYSQIILKLTRGRSIFLTVQALRELSDALTRIGNDTSCKILILNGIGDAFCLGVDLKALVGPRKNITTTEMAIAVKDCIEALSHFKKPLAAVVNGPAIGLGMTLLNHVDFTIASDTATFCMPNVFLGYMPEGGATLTLPQVVGSTVAMDLLLRGTQLSAQQALNIGLISEVVKSECLPEELVSRVKKFAGGSLSALETTKSILKMQLHVNLPLVLENEVKLLPRMWLTRTCQDAMRKALCSGILSE